MKWTTETWLFSLLLMKYLPEGQTAICTKRICTYNLTVAYGWTMRYKDNRGVTYPVVLNGSTLKYANNSLSLSPDKVITADGFPRKIFTVNGQYPGPPIEVIEGAEVVVRVTNNLSDYPVSIHFHGIRQLNTYFMDGAAAVTMCPIPPGGSFEHRFIADPIGTHWYHEHTRLVYADGLYGFFIVHPRNAIPPNSAPDFLVTVHDWYHENASAAYGNDKHLCENGAIGASVKPANSAPGCAVDGTNLIPGTYESALIGGRGRWQNKPFPLSQYIVAGGSTRRFRLLNSGFWFPMQVSIDGHKLRIVASDGGPIQPIVVDSLFIHIGERIDFELVANQSPGRYWIRARAPCVDDEALAILTYQSVATNGTPADPVTRRSQCTASSPCKVFNCPFANYPASSNLTCITMGDALSSLTTKELREEYGVGDPESEVLTYFLNFGMVVGGSINARRFQFPAVPYFIRRPPPCIPRPCVDACHCRCSHTLTLPYNKTIQFVVSNLQPNESLVDSGVENLHFHGHKFAVMAMEFPTYNSVTGHWTTANDDISCQGSDLCWNNTWSPGRKPSFRNVSHPVVKDTMVIPTRGYIVIRFRSMNPGPFMLHCHLDSHVMEGMAMIIDTAPDKWPPLPRGFPTFCDPAATTPRPSKTTTKKPEKPNNHGRRNCRKSRGPQKAHCPPPRDRKHPR